MVQVWYGMVYLSSIPLPCLVTASLRTRPLIATQPARPANLVCTRVSTNVDRDLSGLFFWLANRKTAVFLSREWSVCLLLRLVG